MTLKEQLDSLQHTFNWTAEEYGCIEDLLRHNTIRVIEEIIKKYGHYNDGCGCCSEGPMLGRKITSLLPDPQA